MGLGVGVGLAGSVDNCFVGWKVCSGSNEGCSSVGVGTAVVGANVGETADDGVTVKGSLVVGVAVASWVQTTQHC